MDEIKLMLVDDHDVVRTGLKTFLLTQEGIDVIAEANSGETAVELVSSVQPDLIVMDITMENMDGLEATRQIKKVSPECKVLALTVHTDKQYFFEMLAAGADGYITKQAAADDLVSAIRAVAAGHVYLQPALATWLLEDYRRLVDHSTGKSLSGEQPVKGLEHLSKREVEVLQTVSQGLTNVEIGERLGISHKTVARHRERIMAKLDLHSCAELVKFAIRAGLVDLD